MRHCSWRLVGRDRANMSNLGSFRVENKRSNEDRDDYLHRPAIQQYHFHMVSHVAADEVTYFHVVY